MTQSRGKSTTGSVAQIGNHIVKSGSTLQSLTALSVGEAEFYASGEKKSSWIIPEIYVLKSIPMKIKIPSDSLTAKSLTDRLGAGHREKHTDTRYFWIQGTSPRWRPQYQEGAYSEELRRCWNETGLCFRSTTTLQVCRTGVLLTMDPILHYKMKGLQAHQNQKH